MELHRKSDSGIGLIETMIAMLVLTVGAIGMASMFLHGMKTASGSPSELMATHKAAEAMESVFSARDSHTVTWEELRNVNHEGIFLVGPQPMNVAGADGLLNTADDGELESLKYPGPDHLLDTADDKFDSLAGFTREIKIVDVTEDLRSITVTITYNVSGTKQEYKLTTYISSVA